jgi:hypothetical protein
LSLIHLDSFRFPVRIGISDSRVFEAVEEIHDADILGTMLLAQIAGAAFPDHGRFGAHFGEPQSQRTHDLMREHAQLFLWMLVGCDYRTDGGAALTDETIGKGLVSGESGRIRIFMFLKKQRGFWI